MLLKRRNSIYIFSLLLLAVTTIIAQENIHGIGILQPHFILGEQVMASDPSYFLQFELYDKNGFATGHCLERSVQDNDSYEVIFIDKNGSRSFVTFKNTGLVWTGYKSMSLQFYEHDNMFTKVFVNNQEYYLSDREIIKNGFQKASWETYFDYAARDFNEVIYNLNLRDQPSINGSRIALIQKNRGNKNYHRIKLLGQREGQWLKVECLWWNSFKEACSQKSPHNRKVGWIKYIDNSRYPNIFNIPIPCG